MAAAAAAPLVQAWQRSPNDRIRLGQIGCSRRSRDHLSELVKAGENAAIVGVCDVWRGNREQRAADIEKTFGAKPKQTTHYEELLAMPDIDAVLIATPDMTHPHIMMDAKSHMANFLRCVRSRGTPRASVDNGFHHAVAGCMATVSLETGRRAAFDPDRLEIV
jgi:hypothetical protein